MAELSGAGAVTNLSDGGTATYTLTVTIVPFLQDQMPEGCDGAADITQEWLRRIDEADDDATRNTEAGTLTKSQTVTLSGCAPGAANLTVSLEGNGHRLSVTGTATPTVECCQIVDIEGTIEMSFVNIYE